LNVLLAGQPLIHKYFQRGFAYSMRHEGRTANFYCTTRPGRLAEIPARRFIDNAADRVALGTLGAGNVWRHAPCTDYDHFYQPWNSASATRDKVPSRSLVENLPRSKSRMQLFHRRASLIK